MMPFFYFNHTYLINIFQSGEPIVAKEEKTMLAAFFTLNRMRLEQNNPDLKTYTYNDLPTDFVFNNKTKTWIDRTRYPRKFDAPNVGRISPASAAPADAERFFLRLLLYVVKGPTSFADLRTGMYG
jgi:hypothetical protein